MPPFPPLWWTISERRQDSQLRRDSLKFICTQKVAGQLVLIRAISLLSPLNLEGLAVYYNYLPYDLGDLQTKCENLESLRLLNILNI